ncbi:MAG: Gamma-glutamyltransferase [Microbacteriaceae bacterium]|nr:Gamma-glutamyltransferase [Microbacteriaceae bacterium]
MTGGAPTHSVFATEAMVSTVDSLATQAGIAMLRRGGSAVDAAIAANAVLTVTLPNQCGIGGDLFALVQSAGGPVESLVAAGRAGSGADPDRLRAEGRTRMPDDADPRSITVPGCVDGWLALHERHGRIALDELVAPAIWYAREGFPASRYFAEGVTKRAGSSPEAAAMTVDGRLDEGMRVIRPGAARVLDALAGEGRSGVFEGEFGRGLLAVGDGEFSEADLAVNQAEWVDAVSLDVWGTRLWTAPPPSQGYQALSAAWIAEQLGLGSDPSDPAWAHLLIEAMRQVAYDRPRVLFDGANAGELLDPQRLRPRATAIDASRTAELSDSYRRGGTTYLCVVDSDGMAVSLIQSNCMSFGSGLVAGTSGIWLHNRGIGFDLEPGGPNEYRPRRRPAHTLAPALVTELDGTFRAAIGTRGGDSQPQVVLQLLARALVSGQKPDEALAAGRWILRGTGDTTSFNTWGFGGQVRVGVEEHVPAGWLAGLEKRGHTVFTEPAFSHAFGHAQMIVSDGSTLMGAADPRATAEAAAGY